MRRVGEQQKKIGATEREEERLRNRLEEREKRDRKGRQCEGTKKEGERERWEYRWRKRIHGKEKGRNKEK